MGSCDLSSRNTSKRSAQRYPGKHRHCLLCRIINTNAKKDSQIVALFVVVRRESILDCFHRIIFGFLSPSLHMSYTSYRTKYILFFFLFSEEQQFCTQWPIPWSGGAPHWLRFYPVLGFMMSSDIQNVRPRRGQMASVKTGKNVLPQTQSGNLHC